MTKDENSENSVKINIYLIRHGMSETNEMQKKGIIGWIMHLFKRDPKLVKEGIEKSKRKGNWLEKMQKRTNRGDFQGSFKYIDYSTCNLVPKQFDYVLASELLRAIETAVNMFKEKKMYVAPYISEIQGYKNALPLEKQEQQNFISSKYPKSNVDWKYIEETTRPNFKNFQEFVKKFILDKNEVKKSVDIAVVTHSLYMMKYAITPSEYDYNCCYLWRLKVDKPQNNSIYKITI